MGICWPVVLLFNVVGRRVSCVVVLLVTLLLITGMLAVVYSTTPEGCSLPPRGATGDVDFLDFFVFRVDLVARSSISPGGLEHRGVPAGITLLIKAGRGNDVGDG